MVNVKGWQQAPPQSFWGPSCSHQSNRLGWEEPTQLQLLPEGGFDLPKLLSQATSDGPAFDSLLVHRPCITASEVRVKGK